MDDHVTISTFQLFKLFPDEPTARSYFESRRWPDGPHCPVCANSERITTRENGFYRCNACKEDFTVRTGTIFERSHVPLHKWLYAMYLLVTARKGISSLQLSKQIGVTQKTAWFLLHRIRKACGNDLEKLRGTVEVDETYVGGKEANKHESQKLHMGRGTVGKTPVIGLRERGGRTVAYPVESVDAINLRSAVYKHVEPGAKIHTDEAAAYGELDGLFFRHEAVNHSLGEFVRGDVTVNGIESAWAVMKRGINGVYHHVSKKHLGRYVNEFTFRLNEGKVDRHTLNRIASLLTATVGKRLTYEGLTQ